MSYLGDGVQAWIDGEDVVLVTTNGISVTNRIVLEPEVLARFLEFLSDHQAAEGQR